MKGEDEKEHLNPVLGDMEEAELVILLLSPLLETKRLKDLGQIITAPYIYNYYYY